MTGQGSDLDGVLLSKVTPTICPLTPDSQSFSSREPSLPFFMGGRVAVSVAASARATSKQVSSWIWNTSVCYSLAETPSWGAYNVCFCLWVVKVGKSGWMCMGGGEGSAAHKLTIIFIFTRPRMRSGWEVGFSRACLLHSSMDTQRGTNFLSNSHNSHSVLACPSGRGQLQS